ncbi:hypothetical protein AGMMS4957_00570 [Bacteroidia bacterium]|nr:hypothetical protein AGMMS4957_00570 [Bacteroidia bacterium]
MKTIINVSLATIISTLASLLAIYEFVDKKVKEQKQEQVEDGFVLKIFVFLIQLFSKKNKEKFSRFPSKQDLQSTDWWKYFEPFDPERTLKINPIHTCIGVPYGKGASKANDTMIGNTLYRIRTTKNYYADIKDKKKNLPDIVEIELWTDIYAKVQVELEKWLEENKLPKVDDGKHLDSNRQTGVKVIKINRILDKHSVAKLNAILKEDMIC